MKERIQRLTSISDIYRSQTGSGDSGAIILLFVVCSFLSIALIVINWMGEVREERAERDMQWWNKRNAKAVNVHREPMGYEVVFKNTLLGYRIDQ